MSLTLAKYFYRHFVQLPGWRTNRKIVVIESDDWGSIRMPSREVYKKCLNAGYPVDRNAYERYDSLASEEDLVLLFDLLTSFKDKNGTHPVITANCVVANPDFKKIRETDFQEYHYELITETFRRYSNHANNLFLWKQGLVEKIFVPQFHAREHLNVSLFMKALQKGDEDAHWGFNNGMPGSIRKGKEWNGNYFVEATYFDTEEDKRNKLEIYLEGLDIFEKLFGYKSLSVIPANYTWSKDYNQALKEKGVKFIQGIRKMREPALPKPIFYNRHLGMVNKAGQLALVRNCRFEPSLDDVNNGYESCMAEIAVAFHMNKPAIISSHRVNFVGYLDHENRDRNLRSLKKLLSSILTEWPSVEFMTTVDLGNLITESTIRLQ